MKASTHAVFLYGIIFYEDVFGDEHESKVRLFSDVTPTLRHLDYEGRRGGTRLPDADTQSTRSSNAPVKKSTIVLAAYICTSMTTRSLYADRPRCRRLRSG